MKRAVTQRRHPPLRSCLPSSLILSSHCNGRQNLKFDGGGEMITAESEAEKRERQHREREAMRQAIAAYTGPITKCPPGKVARERHGWPRRRTPEKARNVKAGAISAAAQAHATLWPPMRSL